MIKHIFDKNVKKKIYNIIFLCGSKYQKSDEKDKRNVLRDHLQSKSNLYKPIILEDNFIFARDSSKDLRYGDIYMKNLYDVEFLVSKLSDYILIFQESISTAGESGLFLGDSENRKKTCLILPNRESVEEDKLGTFLRLSFFNKYDKSTLVKSITYYPKVSSNIISENLRNLHTSFVNNRISGELSRELLKFLRNTDKKLGIKHDISKGKEFSLVKIDDKTLKITILPEKIFLCVASILSQDYISEKLFNDIELDMRSRIDILLEEFTNILIATFEEEKGVFSKNPKVIFDIAFGTIDRNIGISLYLLKAAGFIKIRKTEDYEEKGTVVFVKRKDSDGNYFLKKYSDFICSQSYNEELRGLL